MSVNHKGLIALQNNLEQLIKDMPRVMDELIVGEGIYAVKKARKLVIQKRVVNLGAYRQNFHCGDKALTHSTKDEHDGAKPTRQGTRYRIDFYNNLEYANPLEYGFRSHYVPGEYLSGPYRRKFPKGMFVGPYKGFVRGHFIFRTAVRHTKETQDARLGKKITKIMKERLL